MHIVIELAGIRAADTIRLRIQQHIAKFDCGENKIGAPFSITPQHRASLLRLAPIIIHIAAQRFWQFCEQFFVIGDRIQRGVTAAHQGFQCTGRMTIHVHTMLMHQLKQSIFIFRQCADVVAFGFHAVQHRPERLGQHIQVGSADVFLARRIVVIDERDTLVKIHLAL